MMTDRIVVGTGWCGFPEGHNNPLVSRRTQDGHWMERFWKSAIEAQIYPVKYFVYHSNCLVPISYPWPGMEIVNAIEDVKKQPHYQDWFASVLMAAMYAWMNKANLVYIEQDCLVRGLAGAIRWAKDYDHVYGYGDETSWRHEWAEHSFFWTKHEAIPWFIGQVWKAIDDVENRRWGGWPEVAMQLYLDPDIQDRAVGHWPFGYGRKRPIDLRRSQFFIQQPTDEEIDNVLTLIHEDARKRGAVEN